MAKNVDDPALYIAISLKMLKSAEIKAMLSKLPVERDAAAEAIAEKIAKDLATQFDMKFRRIVDTGTIRYGAAPGFGQND
jgi:CHASE3 domain sensor protein